MRKYLEFQAEKREGPDRLATYFVHQVALTLVKGLTPHYPPRL